MFLLLVPILRSKPAAQGVNGACNTATTATATSSAPTALCATGTGSTPASTGGQWAWMCNGTGGSTVNASCNAPFAMQTITITANPTSIAIGGTSTVTASSTSNLKPTLSSTTTGFCTLGAQSDTATGVTASATATHAGMNACTVKATRAADADNCTSCFQAATDKTVDITVTQSSQTITFGVAPTGITVGGATGTVSATSSAGLTVSFTSTTTSDCTVSGTNGSTVTGLKAGTDNCIIAADQAGNTDFSAAPQLTQKISIAAAPTGPVNGACGGANGATTATAPTTNLCGDGSNPTVTDNGSSFSWSCAGTGGGTTASCAAMKSATTTTASAPTGLSATAGDGKATLTFVAPSSNGGAAITNYSYSIDGGMSFQSANPAVTISPAIITGLINGTTYSIKLQAVNSAGNGTASDAVSATPQAEADVDGVGDSTESPVPSANGGTGDGNGDGTPDSQQSNVASLPTIAGTFATVAVSGTGITLSNVMTAATPSDFPATSAAPLSGLAFTVNGVGMGASQVIDLFFPASAGITGLSKRNFRTGAFEVLPTKAIAVGNKTRIRFTLTDGGDFDADRMMNGAIQDPVFPFVGGGGSGGGGGGGAFSALPLLFLSLLALLKRISAPSPAWSGLRPFRAALRK